MSDHQLEPKEAAMDVIRVLLVDDHELVRRGVSAVLEDEEDIQVVAQTSDGAEGVKRAEELRPDVVLMDLRMPGTTGLQATAILKQTAPEIAVLVLTVSEQAQDLQEVLRVGAMGYILKGAPPEELVQAVRQVAQGWVVVSPTMASKLMADFPQARGRGDSVPGDGHLTSALSEREYEVLQLLANGSSNREIAETLFVSENTVKTHMRNILTKLHLKNRTQAAGYARQLGPTPNQ